MRDAERMAQNDIRSQLDPMQRANRKKDSDTVALERTLSDALGLDVSISHKGNGGQVVSITRRLSSLKLSAAC